MSLYYDLEIRALEAEGLLKLRRGDYSGAAQLFWQQYELMLKIQDETDIRQHKGGPLHNYGVSLLFQGKSPDAIKHLLLAYIEDLLSSPTLTVEDAYLVDNLPASRVLRGLCGVVWQDFEPIERFTIEKKREEPSILRPEIVYDFTRGTANQIISNYERYLKDSWRYEVEGQKAFERQDFESGRKVYQDWYELLMEYQNARQTRAHKGHVLFNIGYALISQGNIRDSLSYFLYAHIENVLSERKQGQARDFASYQVLTINFGIRESFIKLLDEWLWSRRKEGLKQNDPKNELKSFLDEKKEEPQPRKEITPPKRLEMALSKKKIDEIEGKFATRVFIGGNYGKIETYRQIASLLGKRGYTPIIAIDYEPPKDDSGNNLLDIHDMDILLIHLCRYVLFDVTLPGAEYSEVEWAVRMFDKPTYAIKVRQSSVSEHIHSLLQAKKIQIHEYEKIEEIQKFIEDTFPVQ